LFGVGRRRDGRIDGWLVLSECEARQGEADEDQQRQKEE
jgi:hypothetical protein